MSIPAAAVRVNTFDPDLTNPPFVAFRVITPADVNVRAAEFRNMILSTLSPAIR